MGSSLKSGLWETNAGRKEGLKCLLAPQGKAVGPMQNWEQTEDADLV